MRVAAFCLGLLCTALASAPARAEPNEADRATARALAVEGHAALQQKDYAKAADRFKRADALVHAPTLVVDWARALQGLGRFVEAHEKYEVVLREGVDSSSPVSWTRALEEAQKELETLKPRLAWVTVILKEPADASVTIDGVPIPPAALGVKRAADPGFPEVRATAAGYQPFAQSVTVGPGEERSIEITLYKVPEGAPPPVSEAVYRPRQHSNTQRTLAYVALGVGGASLVAGGVTGGLALMKRSTLQDECHGEKCPSSSADTIDAYHTLGTVSAITLGVGVAGIGTGIVLLLTDSKPADAPRTGLRWQPLIGLGMLGAEGSFQ